MKWFKYLLVVSVSLFSFLPLSSYAADELLVFESEEQRLRYVDLTFQLRCPKCQNQNVADSNAPISEDIREKTYQLIKEGYSDQEIIDFMIERYTEFVIYKPQMSLVTVWLWVLPGLVLLGGLAALIYLTRSRKQVDEESLTDEERERLNSILKDDA
ncbi:cytochrome c-type biogenesis protein [Reinekea marinisedimentorum]|uniref:Cytochrome c-type biogenesis protein n=1 Tax=Reinekea marinisedimentorum TaxID=230495 RepID=A0A4R3I822_9GAMM|nr:cytochrome c-type biogenesis protein [Reinekea marinisedimentorum]TCS41424.1 cytochrome c-type biogenesis protein CcmH [Reinekea marinisedimentorum]